MRFVSLTADLMVSFLCVLSLQLDHRTEGSHRQGYPHDLRCEGTPAHSRRPCPAWARVSLSPLTKSRCSTAAAGATLDILEEETAGTVPIGCVIIRGSSEAVQQAKIAVEGLLAYSDARLAKAYSTQARRPRGHTSLIASPACCFATERPASPRVTLC